MESINKDRMFNQLTGINSDSCEYKQKLDLSTKPLKYYINPFNNISELTDNANFTLIGNSRLTKESGIFERSLPSNLNNLPSLYEPAYSTTPFLASKNNINVSNTDIDLELKTGLKLRSINNQAELSERKWPIYGDILSKSINKTYQNFGKLNLNKSITSSVNNINIPGLNVMPNSEYNQRMNDPSRMFVDTYVANQNYFNGPL